MNNIFIKDPNAVLDYQFDWTGWLATNETIVSHTIIVPVVTGTVVVDSDDELDGVVTVWLSGGTAGVRGPLTCRIVTNQGRTDDRTIILQISER